MNIKIGDKNKIKNSSIGHSFGSKNENNSFASRHPIFISFLTSLIVGFILLFSFWGKIIAWLERLL